MLMDILGVLSGSLFRLMNLKWIMLVDELIWWLLRLWMKIWILNGKEVLNVKVLVLRVVMMKVFWVLGVKI